MVPAPAARDCFVASLLAMTPQRETPMPYAAPLDDMRLAIDTVAPLDQLPGGRVEADLADAILNEAAKFAAAELDPLNHPADRVGSVLENGIVRTPPGFRA